MKKIVLLSLFLAIAFYHTAISQNNSQLPTSINENGALPDNSAILDVQSTTKGMLVPRMTTAQRSAIASPATGLLVFDTTTGGFWFYDSVDWNDLSKADDDWTETPNGIYHNTGKVTINTTTIDNNSNLFVFRPLGDYGPDKAAIYGYRSGYSSVQDSGGINFAHVGIDAAIKGFSNWGNSFTAGVAGYSYLDYANSAAVLGGQQSGNVYGGLGFRDSTQIWAGYFNGDIRFRPESNYSPELYLDIVREYENQGEFGEWHKLYVLPNARNVNGFNLDFYYLGNDANFFDGLYCNTITPENSLRLNGQTIIPGDNKLGIGTNIPGRKLHVKQDVANKAIRIEHHTDFDYWDTGVGAVTKNYKFYFNNTTKVDIAATDGEYIITSDRSLKKNITYLQNVLPNVLKLRPAKYHYIDNEDDQSQKAHGFIAQEVETVFPELIRKQDNGKKALAYNNFSVLAIQAIQEQQAIIDETKAENQVLKGRLDQLEKLVKELMDKK